MGAGFTSEIGNDREFERFRGRAGKIGEGIWASKP